MKAAVNNNRILNNLNKDQIEVATNLEGLYRVLASPGSGKSETIIRRVAYMIENGISPSDILVFTFTKKAANEIQERLESYIGEDKATFVTTGTYHSFCNRLLRKYANLIGYKNNFSIYDDKDASEVLKKVIKDKFNKPAGLKVIISGFKDKMISPEQAMNNAKEFPDNIIAGYYSNYQTKLKQCNSMDFDDLIYNSVRLLENNDLVLKRVTNKYRYIIADESQDSSYRDIQLIKLLTENNNNLALVGDLNQSIYGFRGANPKALMDVMFEKPIKNIRLERNYRSTQTIVNASENLIKHNESSEDKDSYSQNPVGDKIEIYAEDDDVFQASRVQEIILKAKQDGYKNSDIGILYRTHYSFQRVEPKLISGNIPYVVFGGLPFYAKKEIKDILSFLRFLSNNNDFVALERILNTPKRGIGDKTKENIIKHIQEKQSTNLNINDILESLITEKVIKGKLKEKAGPFINDLINLLGSKDSSTITELIDLIIEKIGYVDYLNESEDDESVSANRLENIKILKEIATNYEDLTLEDFLYSLALSEPIKDEETDTDKVSAMTIHSSKGLEFKIVIIIDASEGVIPHYKSFDNTLNEEEITKNLEEERRLFYVAVTRAKEKLFIVHTKLKVNFGTPHVQEPSRFIGELGKEYCSIKC